MTDGIGVLLCIGDVRFFNGFSLGKNLKFAVTSRNLDKFALHSGNQFTRKQ